MLSPRAVAAGLQVRRQAIAIPRLSEGAVLALVALAAYMLMAIVLVFGFDYVIGDAWSRITNAYYVLYSRDPHLAAMGFVWSPLPSLMAIPLLPLKAVFPPLVELGFIANLYSVIFMAGAVYMVWGILYDLGVKRWMRLLIVVGFAIHPMILQYGGNGMTEAAFLFLTLAIVRYLGRWLIGGDIVALVYAGVFLGITYTVRYEALPIGAATALLVLTVGFLRAGGTVRFRTTTAIADALVFSLPLALAFLIWTGVSWLITGALFEQFGSIYGTTAQLTASAQNLLYWQSQGRISIPYVIDNMAVMQPFLVVIGAAALALAAWRREVRVLAIVAVFGSVLVFAAWAYLTGKTTGFVRYYIVAIPLAVLLAGSIVGRAPPPPQWARLPPTMARLGAGLTVKRRDVRGRRTWRGVVPITAVVLFGMLLTGAPATIAAFSTERIGMAQEYTNGVGRISASREIAAMLDDMDLPDGAVLLDVFLGFGIVADSKHPQQFVITPDRDFKSVLSDPQAFDTEYILVPEPHKELSELDAINRDYPTMWDDGAGIATLVRSFDDHAPYLIWRLYRIDR